MGNSKPGNKPYYNPTTIPPQVIQTALPKGSSRTSPTRLLPSHLFQPKATALFHQPKKKGKEKKRKKEKKNQAHIPPHPRLHRLRYRPHCRRRLTFHRRMGRKHQAIGSRAPPRSSSPHRRATRPSRERHPMRLESCRDGLFPGGIRVCWRSGGGN